MKKRLPTIPCLVCGGKTTARQKYIVDTDNPIRLRQCNDCQAKFQTREVDGVEVMEYHILDDGQKVPVDGVLSADPIEQAINDAIAGYGSVAEMRRASHKILLHNLKWFCGDPQYRPPTCNIRGDNFPLDGNPRIVRRLRPDEKEELTVLAEAIRRKS